MEQLEPFLDDLASSAPVPGGGSAAAVTAAMGAALLAMVSNLTLGKKRYADVQDRAERTRGEAMALLDHARRLSEEDSEAYGRVSAALALPRSTDSEMTERRTRVQSALKHAAQPPLETMQVAADVARLAAELVSFGNRSAITDIGSAALLAGAAHAAARLNVLANLTAIRDDDWKASFVERLNEVPDPRPSVEDVQEQVQRALDAG
jgi:formiminotetrahydrofolate cyclodeaminase